MGRRHRLGPTLTAPVNICHLSGAVWHLLLPAVTHPAAV